MILYRSREVECDRLQAGAALNEMLTEGPVDAVIGPDCSLACESAAYITALRGLPQVSYSCSSSALLDKTEFPTVRLLFAPRAARRESRGRLVHLDPGGGAGITVYRPGRGVTAAAAARLGLTGSATVSEVSGANPGRCPSQCSRRHSKR
jgi:hypothetical protein